MPEEFKRCVHCREQIELINFSLEITDSVVEISKIRMFTSEEVIQIANETSDNQGNLYRIDFINRIKHEASLDLPEDS